MLKKIYEGNSASDADIVFSYLQSGDFHPLNPTNTASIEAGGSYLYYVLIPIEEYVEAKKCLLESGFKNIM